MKMNENDIFDKELNETEKTIDRLAKLLENKIPDNIDEDVGTKIIKWVYDSKSLVLFYRSIRFKDKFIQLSKKAISKSSKKAIDSLVYIYHNTDMKSMLSDNPVLHWFERNKQTVSKENKEEHPQSSYHPLLSYVTDNSNRIRKTILVGAGVLSSAALIAYAGAKINLANQIKNLHADYSITFGSDSDVKYLVDFEIKDATAAINFQKEQSKQGKITKNEMDNVISIYKTKFHDRYQAYSNMSVEKSLKSMFGIETPYVTIDKVVTDRMVEPEK